MTDNEKPTSNFSKIYCFDIDGTICNTTGGEYEKAEVIKETVSQINYLYENGNKIILFTERGTTTNTDWSDLTENQLKKWGVKYHQLKLGKPVADFYIDDKGLSLKEWGDTFNKIKNAEFAYKNNTNLTDEDIMKGSKYLSTKYSNERAPKTNYPANLAKYISTKFFKKKALYLN